MGALYMYSVGNTMALIRRYNHRTICIAHIVSLGNLVDSVSTGLLRHAIARKQTKSFAEPGRAT